MEITKRFDRIINKIPANVKLVAVSKTKPIEDILTLYNHGHKIFGENKVQELVSKYESLPKDIEWHMIGHMQSNKVKNIVSFIHMIHGVDSLKLLTVIEKEAVKSDRVINCLLQIHIGQEETKFGFSKEEIFEMIKSEEFNILKNINICGLMGMATFTDNKQIIKNEFSALKKLFDELKQSVFSGNPYFKTLSMGMSDDFLIAVQEGSNLVRIGSSIFGERNY